MLEVGMVNPAIRGWRVKNLVRSGARNAQSQTNVSVPIDVGGSLTGEFVIFGRGVDEASCRSFAHDERRLREALLRRILPHVDYESERTDYWTLTEALTGDDLLASRVALVVEWDGISIRTGRVASYVPWLQLLQS
jgi:hypothetical protein